MTTETFAQTIETLYHASTEPQIIEVPPLLFLMIDGAGDPNTTPQYHDALEALYALAYGLKFRLKRRDPALDFKVPALEGLWWADDMASFSTADRNEWQWTMMIAVPDTVDHIDLEAVIEEAQRKGKTPAVRRVRLERYYEGRSAQVLHRGPYSAEAPTIARLHASIAAQGYRPGGKHHEIYLGDPRRSAPEKLRTVIRQPIA